MEFKTMVQEVIGLVGLGTMGSRLAHNLLEAGYRVVGFDQSQGPLDNFRNRGGEISSSVAEVADVASYVMTVVPEPTDLIDVVAGTDGITSASEPPTIVIDFSTVDPNTSVRAADLLLERSINFLECKMAGSSEDATAGTLRLLAGGREEDLSLVRHILEPLCNEVVYCGEVGAGSAMKLVHNMLAFTIMLADAEALVLGVKSGLSLDLMLDLFRRTVVWNRPLEAIFEKLVLKRDFEPGMMTRLALKDLRLANQFASQVGAMTPFGLVTQQMLGVATFKGAGEDNFIAAVKLWEDVAGVELKESI